MALLLGLGLCKKILAEFNFFGPYHNFFEKPYKSLTLAVAGTEEPSFYSNETSFRVLPRFHDEGQAGHPDHQGRGNELIQPMNVKKIALPVTFKYSLLGVVKMKCVSGSYRSCNSYKR